MKKLILIFCLVFCSVCLWAGTKKLTLGNPPAQSAVTVSNSPNCIDRVVNASNRDRMLVALASWSSCSGRQLNLGNLVKIGDGDVDDIKNNATSDDALFAYLSQLTNPITQASTSFIAKVKAAMAKPEIQCVLPGDQYNWEPIGMNTLNFRVLNPGCNYENLHVSFQAGEACTVVSQVGTYSPNALGDGNAYISFDIFIDTTILSQQGSNNCHYSVYQNTVTDTKVTGGFWTYASCNVVTSGTCPGDLVDYQTARSALGCSDDSLNNAIQGMYNIVLGDDPTIQYEADLPKGYVKAYVNNVNFKDYTWYQDPSNQTQGQSGDVCMWSTPSR